MSCSTEPKYWSLISIDAFDGSVMVLGVFDCIEAVTTRLVRIHPNLQSGCGDEYHIECFTLSTLEKEKSFAEAAQKIGSEGAELEAA